MKTLNLRRTIFMAAGIVVAIAIMVTTNVFGAIF